MQPEVQRGEVTVENRARDNALLASTGFDTNSSSLKPGYLPTLNKISRVLNQYGKGETDPRADNNTEAGRQLNRRIELWILPVVAN